MLYSTGTYGLYPICSRRLNVSPHYPCLTSKGYFENAMASSQEDSQENCDVFQFQPIKLRAYGDSKMASSLDNCLANSFSLLNPLEILGLTDAFF